MAWRHTALRDCQVSVADDLLCLDAEGYVTAGVSPAATAKLKQIPSWSEVPARAAPTPELAPVTVAPIAPVAEPAPKGKRTWPK